MHHYCLPPCSDKHKKFYFAEQVNSTVNETVTTRYSFVAMGQSPSTPFRNCAVEGINELIYLFDD